MEWQVQWGETIRTLRNQRELSVEKLAEIAGINAGHLSRVERGLAGIGDEARVRLCRALGVQVKEIFVYPDTREAANGAGGGSDV